MTQTYQLWVWTAQSVQRLATGLTVRGSIPVVERSVADRLLGLWVRILPVAWTFVLCELYTKDKTRSRPAAPWGPPSLYNGYRIIPGGKTAGKWR